MFRQLQEMNAPPVFSMRRRTIPNEFRAERAHPFQLRSWRGLNHHDGTGHTCLLRRVGYALPSVSRTDCPDSALALRIREQRDGIRRAAQLIGINRLQVLQLESNVRKIR